MTNKNIYTSFDLEDFIENEHFRNWVLHEDHNANIFWEKFQQENPEKTNLVKEAQSVLLSLHHHFDTEIKEVSKDQARSSFQEVASKMEKRPRDKSKRIWLKWMAAAAVLVGIGFFSKALFNNDILLKTYASGNGERLALELPDGSKVELNANSELQIEPDHWNDLDTREVWLQGEAFFEVNRKSKGTKFIVHAGDMDVAVLGTQFNVRSRGEKAEVVLAEGKIVLELNDQNIEMEPGDFVSYSKIKNKVEAKKVKVADYTAWKDGMIVLNNTLSEICKELEIVYGTNFVIEDEELKKRQIQLSVQAGNLEVILKTLKLLYPDEINIDHKENQVIISKLVSKY